MPRTLQIRRIATSAAGPADAELVLDYDARKKSRFRAKLGDGTEVFVQLPRGSELSHGTRLLADDGTLVRIVAAPEPLSVTLTDDPLLHARAAYHLGNRHVPLEITPGRLRYRHDHVLDAMLVRLGLDVAFENGPFVPEPGAYGGGHVHGHTHGSGHEHGEHGEHGEHSEERDPNHGHDEPSRRDGS